MDDEMAEQSLSLAAVEDDCDDDHDRHEVLEAFWNNFSNRELRNDSWEDNHFR